MPKDLKREEFDVIKPSEDGASGGGKSSMEGVTTLDPKGGDKSQGDDDDSKSTPQKGDSQESKEEGGEGGEGEPSSDLIKDRGQGQMLSEEESDRLIKEAGLEQGKKVDSNEIIDEAARAIEQVQSNRKSMGHGGGGALRKRLAELNTPKVDWRAVLKRYIGNLMSKMEEYFGNRKFIGTGDYLYGDRPKYDAVNKCAIAIDVSGSVAGDEDFKEFVSEVAALAHEKKINEIHILPFAEKVKDEFIIKNRQPKLEDFDNVRRGGGTEAIPHVINYVNNMKGGQVSFVIIITDGYLTSGLPQPPKWGTKTIWLIYGNPTFERDFGFDPRWGRTIHLEFGKDEKGSPKR